MLSFERDRIFAQQPIAGIQQFAQMLGWRGLMPHLVQLPSHDVARLGIEYVFGYSTGDLKFFLQLNQSLHGQTKLYAASVAAERYGITATPFYDFEYFEDPRLMEAEARRLTPLLHRHNFKDARWRREFLRQYPERATRLRKSKLRRSQR